MTPNFLTLSSGRKLAYDLYGDPDGQPIFYFHGWPSSRVQGALMDQVGKELGLRIATMDRPGIGQSDYQPGRRLLDWPPVLAELAAHLGWEKFHVMGVSGGGPYVLATAFAMPERLLSANVVCGAPPLRLFGTRDMFWPYRLVLFLRNLMPWMLSPAFRISCAISRCKPSQPPLRWLIQMLDERDRQALGNEQTYQVIVESFRECLVSGVPQVRADGDIYLDDWGFDLKDIPVPVHIWHGLKDRNIPCSYAQKIAAQIPQAIPHWTADDGHYSLPVLRVNEIARTALGK